MTIAGRTFSLSSGQREPPPGTAIVWFYKENTPPYLHLPEEASVLRAELKENVWPPSLREGRKIRVDKGPGPHLQKTRPQNKEKTGQTLIIKVCKGEGKGKKVLSLLEYGKLGFFFLIYEFFF